MKIKIIDFGYTHLPKRAHYDDCGADVYSTIDVVIAPNAVAKIPLGFGLEIPNGYAGFIFPRSGMSAKGITAELPPIDAGYRGEIHAILTNNSSTHYTVSRGDRVGQLVILPCVMAEFVTELGDERGEGAFNSTGK
jgi:dUTP pyrophosphatase